MANRKCLLCVSSTKNFSRRQEDDSLIKCANDSCRNSENWYAKALWNKLMIPEREKPSIAIYGIDLVTVLGIRRVTGSKQNPFYDAKDATSKRFVQVSWLEEDNG